jgi:hypothetical protein
VKAARRSRWLAWLAAVAALGCLSPPWARERGRCPVALVATEDLPKDLRMRLRVRLDSARREMHLETIAERVPEGLVVLGVAPYGLRVFAVHQRGREVTIDTPSRSLEEVAVWTLDALHRAYWIQTPPGNATDPSRWVREGERVSEWRQAGLPLRREFAAAGPDGAHGIVAIDYAAAHAEASEPGTRIRNPWCGYEALLIATAASEAESVGSPRASGPRGKRSLDP